MKKSLIFWFAAATCAAWILVGCEQGTGGDGAAGAPGAIYLSGSQTTAGIQDAIDSGAPLVFAGVTQSYTSGNGTVTIPAGRGVKLVGEDAYTVADNAAAFLILGDASSVTGTGVIDAQTSGNVIGPQTVLAASVTGGNKLVYQTIGTGGAITFTDNKAAVNGNVTIAATGVTGTTIPVASLTGNTLYVVGGLTVSSTVTATEISVVGNVTAAAAITGKLSATGNVTFSTAAQNALTGLTAGSVESAVAITTTSNGDITVDGELKTTGATSNVTLGGTGTLTAGSLNLAGNLVVGTATTGAVTVKGAAIIGGTLTNGAEATVFTFNGPATIDTFTSGNAGTVIAGMGAVTVTKALSDTSTNTVIIKNTGGVTLTAANTIADNVVATNITIIGSSTGVTIKSDGTAITVSADASIIVPGTGGSIVAGGDDDNVTITGAVLKAGTYTGTSGKLSLSTTAVIEVANGGAIAVAGSGDLELTLAATKVVLLAGGAVDVKAGTGKFGEATQANTKLTVGTAAAPNTPTKATVVKDGASAVWTVTSTTETGTGETNVILGTLKLAITGTSNVDGAAGAAADGSAAAGKLVAGQGTVLTFIGTGD